VNDGDGDIVGVDNKVAVDENDGVGVSEHTEEDVIVVVL
jgi:hypothetical protein